MGKSGIRRSVLEKRDVIEHFQGQIWNPWQKSTKKNAIWYNITKKSFNLLDSVSGTCMT